jgi:4-carboxymuconolactone decarboxylase
MPRPVLHAAADRLPPIAPSNYTGAQRVAADSLIASPRGEVRGPFIPLLRSPELLDHSQSLGAYLRYRCTVPERLREFAILVIARHWSQAYEWHAHIGPALKTGVAATTLEALAEGAPLVTAEAPEATIHTFVTELLGTQYVSDGPYEEALSLLGEQGLVDLLGLCGYYSMLAMMLNVARTPCPGESFAVPA